MHLAPIVIFVYNRLWHTQQVINALKKNNLAKDSDLFIFSDGSKTPNDNLIIDVRKYLYTIKGFRSIKIIERDNNWGLADNITNGVSEIINKYGKIIVLEDDIITSPGFLKYMNDALDIYMNEDKVMHISGYMFPIKKKMPETFFYNSASCWGWGTWKRAWKYYNNDAKSLLKQLYSNNLQNNFNLNGAYNFTDQLINNISQIKKTWAVKWYASFYLKNGYALHPYPSLTNNIGHDASGENCGYLKDNYFSWKELALKINVNKLSNFDDAEARIAVEKFYRRNKPKKRKLLRQWLRYFLPDAIIDVKNKLKITPTQRELKKNEIERLTQLPRFYSNKTNILDFDIYFPDAASFLFTYDEIFVKQIYNFTTDKNNPFIIDAGANIGLSTIYFKRLYPKCEIIAFEPDTEIYNFLRRNINNFKLDNVQLINKGLWSEITELNFSGDGADGGRIDNGINSSNQKITTDLLSNYLDKNIDLLKIDIEGAELHVLNECKHHLQNVDRIFIEYHSFSNQKQSLSNIVKILEENNFRYIMNSPGLTSKQPFIGINTYMGMDFQLNIFAFRQ